MKYWTTWFVSKRRLTALLVPVSLVLFFALGSSDSQMQSGTAQSQHVYPGSDGRLVYVPYPNGDTIPDFSNAGYGGGGVALPEVPVQRIVVPVDGDDGASIQAAIDEVSAMAPDANGFRGAVLLEAGVYEVAGNVSIRASGVVLRGEGDGPGGTLIKAVGTSRRSVINIAGVGNRTEVAGTRQAITGPYVPVGARSFSVADASGFSVGDDVLVVRTPNQEWIDAIGTDACSTVGTSYDTSDINGQTCISESHWTPNSRIMRYERKITAINGNQITIDAPVVEAFQAEFGGGYVAKYVFPGRIKECGVEYLRSESDFASATDENHATRMISLSNVENAWVRNVTSVYFEQGTVLVGGGAKYVTVQDSSSLDHKSQITGGRRYPFSLDDCSFVLIMRCYAKTGRHDYVTGSNTPGPNVFLDSKAEQSYSELGPHHRWATGSLFDLIRHQSTNRAQIIGAYNRGNSGSGHGWSGAYQLFWNCVGDTHRVASPPYARNWSIGCQTLRKQGDGEFESYGTPVAPTSLYLAQLRDRLGNAALANIGYSALPPPPPPPAPLPTPTPTPTPVPAIRYEAESIPATTSGPVPVPSPDNSASNRMWVLFPAARVGEWIEFTLQDVPAGTFDVVLKYKTNPARGIHNLSVDGVVMGNPPNLLDQYKSGSAAFPEKNFGTVRFSAPGDHVVRLTVVGKNPAASSYNMGLDRFSLIPDITAPVIMSPGDQTVEATGPDGAVATYAATAEDNRDGPVPVTFTPPSGSAFPLGTTEVVATAEDFAGNIARKTFNVNVVDTTAPALALPANITLEATGPGGAVATFTTSATDIVDGDVPVEFSIPSGSIFPLGTTTVTATAADSAENSASGSFTVTVVDTTPPALTLPGDLVLEATGPDGAVATFNASASDIVSGNVPVTLSQPSGSTFPLGTTTVTASATDGAGNTATGSFTVTVRDTTAPVIQSLTASPNILWPPNHKMVNVTLSAQVADLVDSDPVTRIISVTSNEPVNGSGDGNTSPDWEITGNMTLKLRAERAGHGSGRIYTITVESRDRFGNVSTRTVNVTVPHSQSSWLLMWFELRQARALHI